MLSVRLGADLEARLNNLANMTDRSKSFYVRKLVSQHIDELEEQYIAEHRLENPKARLTAEEVRKELGLED